MQLLMTKILQFGMLLLGFLPCARHQYCKWHLGLHECEHIRSLQCAHPTFTEDYYKCAKRSRSIKEFEECWITLRDKYKPDSESF